MPNGRRTLLACFRGRPTGSGSAVNQKCLLLFFLCVITLLSLPLHIDVPLSGTSKTQRTLSADTIGELTRGKDVFHSALQVALVKAKSKAALTDGAPHKVEPTTSLPITTSPSADANLPGWLRMPMPSAEGLSPHDYINNLLAKHAAMQKRMRTGKRPLKAIIGKCINGDSCGGIGDRLFGILTLFAAALVTDRAFFIEHSKPLPQVDYLQPNNLDWRLSTVEKLSVKQKLDDCFSQSSCRYQSLMLDGALLNAPTCVNVLPVVKVSDPVLLMNANMRTECVLKIFMEYGILPKPDTPGWDKTNETHLRIWASYASHLMLKHLFKFAPSIVAKGRQVLRQAGLPPDFDNEETENCLLCIHVRSGTTSFENLHRYDDMAAFGKCAHRIKQKMVKSCPRKVTWLVVSDRHGAAKLIGGSYASPLSTEKLGALIHMDKVGTGEHNREGMTRLYIDFFLVTRCKYLVASLSTFSETASIWRGLSVHRYDMERNNVCSKTAQNIHNWQRDVNIQVHRH